MNNEQLDILESADETSVYRGDSMIATFYGTDTDPSGYANALFFAAARCGPARNPTAPVQHPEPAAAAPLKTSAPESSAQMSLIE